MREMKDSGVEWIGEIPIDWDTAKAKYVFSVVNGATPRSDEPDNWEGNIVWVTPTDMKQPLETLTISEKNITDTGLGSCGTTIVPRGSIVLSTRAPIGKIALAGVDLCTNQGCKALVARKDLSSKFIGYYLFSISDFLVTLGRGTTFIELSTYDLLNLRLPCPTKIQQDKALAYLDAKCAQIDRAIARQQEVIEKLKEYKLSVITEAVSKGLNPNVPMKESGIEWLGEIPTHWTFQRLGDLCSRSITYGIVKLGEEDNNGVKVLRCSDVQPGFINESNIRTVAKTLSDEYSRSILQLGDVVVNVRGTLGGCAVISERQIGFNIAREVAIVPVSLANNRYIMYCLLSMVFSSYQKFSLRGVVYVGLNINLLSRYLVQLPPEDEQVSISDYLDKKCERIDEIAMKKQTIIAKLEEYKKSLVYEVVTGKREV